MKTIILPLAGLLMLSTAWADEWDPSDNNPPGTALSISTANQNHGPHTLTNAVDLADWFSVSLEAGKRYRFESTGAWDVDVRLFSDSAAGAVAVVNDVDHGGLYNFQLLYVPSATQSYYLKVENNHNSGYAEYTLEYYEEPILDAADPADDVYSTAPLLNIEVSEQNDGPHHLSAQDTADWFRFWLAAGVDYTFRAVNGGWDTVGELYFENLSGSPVAEGDDDYEPSAIDNRLNFIINFTPTVTGDYYLKVRGYDEGSDLNYSLVYRSAVIPDSDGDGMSDANEAIAGTDPNDKFSYFAITNWSVGSFTIEWPAFSGRVYRVFRADSLTNTFNQIGPVILYPQNSYTESSLGESGFYKVEVQLQ